MVFLWFSHGFPIKTGGSENLPANTSVPSASTRSDMCPTCRRSRRRTSRLDVWNATAWRRNLKPRWYSKVDTQRLILKGWEFPKMGGKKKNTKSAHVFSNQWKKSMVCSANISGTPQMLDVNLIPMVLFEDSPTSNPACWSHEWRNPSDHHRPFLHRLSLGFCPVHSGFTVHVTRVTPAVPVPVLTTTCHEMTS